MILLKRVLNGNALECFNISTAFCRCGFWFTDLSNSLFGLFSFFNPSSSFLGPKKEKNWSLFCFDLADFLIAQVNLRQST